MIKYYLYLLALSLLISCEQKPIVEPQTKVQRIETYHIHPKDSIERIETIEEFDTNGFVISKIRFNKEGKIRFVKVNKNDDFGNPVEAYWLNNNYELKQAHMSYQNFYNGSGLLDSVYQYHNSRLFLVSRLFYNKDNQKVIESIECAKVDDGRDRYKTILWKYDSYGYESLYLEIKVDLDISFLLKKGFAEGDFNEFPKSQITHKREDKGNFYLVSRQRDYGGFNYNDIYREYRDSIGRIVRVEHLDSLNQIQWTIRKVYITEASDYTSKGCY